MIVVILFVLAAFCFFLSSFPLGSPPKYWGSLVPLGLLFLTMALGATHGVTP